jgi:hypothetical protein
MRARLTALYLRALPWLLALGAALTGCSCNRDLPSSGPRDLTTVEASAPLDGSAPDLHQVDQVLEQPCDLAHPPSCPADSWLLETTCDPPCYTARCPTTCPGGSP